MNMLLRSATRLTGGLKAAVNVATSSSPRFVVRQELARRNFWHMSKRPEFFSTAINVVNSNSNAGTGCACGCAGTGHHVHTKGEKELVEFLTEEILAEKKAQKVKTIPTELDGFQVKLDGADVELTKSAGAEKIVVSFNVNHTVDAENEPEIEDDGAGKAELGEMKSKPNFEVDIVRGNRTLSFTCSFLQGAPAEGEYNDTFGIDEFAIFDGVWHDKNYAVAGDVLDGYLYDLLMNLLEEKGISNEFVEKLGTLATSYEHSSYIGLLESLSKFTVDSTKNEFQLHVVKSAAAAPSIEEPPPTINAGELKKN